MMFGDFEDGRWQPMEGGYWGLQSSPEASRKVAGKHHNRGWGACWPWVERRRREEERESDLNICLVENEVKKKLG